MRSSRLAGIVALTMSASLCAVALESPPAGAAIYTLANPGNITIPDSGAGGADPYPSSIHAYGLGTKVSDVNVTLNGLTHTHGDDLDIELVSPNGLAVPLMSDVCGNNTLTNLNLTFDDAAPASVPDSSVCATGSYRPTDVTSNPPDAWAEAPTGTTLAAFNGINPNGAWRLYVRDDDGDGDGGVIADGWSLTIDTRATPAMTIPGAASRDGRGAANPYPYAIQVGGPSQRVTDVNVVLPLLTHPVPGSLQLLLVGPGGQAVLLMAGACGRTALDEVTFVLDDSADQKLSAQLGTCSSGPRKPTVQDPPTVFAAPAPPGPYATKLSAFKEAPANGTWLLYAVDIRQDDAGYLAGAPSLRISTDRKPPNTKVTKRPRNSTHTRTRIRFVSTENGAKFQCRVDKGKWRRCRSPLELKRLTVGVHKVKVRAIDKSGNVDPTPAKVVWRVKRR